MMVQILYDVSDVWYNAQFAIENWQTCCQLNLLYKIICFQRNWNEKNRINTEMLLIKNKKINFAFTLLSTERVQ